MEFENVDPLVPMDFGEALPVNYFPADLRKKRKMQIQLFQLNWMLSQKMVLMFLFDYHDKLRLIFIFHLDNYLEGFEDFHVNTVQPVEVDQQEITHPIVDGGLYEGQINDAIVDNEEIVFSTTVIVVYPDLLDQNDDNDDEILIGEEIDDLILLNHPIAAIIDELITTELMETEDPLVQDTIDPPVVITTNNVEEIIPVILLVQNEPEANAETADETPQTATPIILAPEVPPNNRETPQTAGSTNEAADQLRIQTEPETANANMNNAVGPRALPMHAHGHHRSKSAEPAVSIPLEENSLPHRSRSATIH